MKRCLLLSLLSCASLSIYAADIPNIVNANTANTRQACIDNATNDCVNTNCINSSALNCTQNCQTVAVNKCKGMTE